VTAYAEITKLKDAEIRKLKVQVDESKQQNYNNAKKVKKLETKLELMKLSREATLDEAKVQGEINNDIKIKGRGWGRVLVVAALGGGILYGLLKEI
jgi:hypothetical protein